MARISKLELRPATRRGGGGKTHRDFLDFVVDGKSLYEEFCSRGLDFISCLGGGSIESHRGSVDRLLLREKSDFEDNRYSIFICPECGDLGCGAISIKIAVDGDLIVWDAFGYENNYDPETPLLDNYRDLKAIRFDHATYEAVLMESLQNVKL